MRVTAQLTAYQTQLDSCASVFSHLFFYCSGDHRDLHSFPTRRSSDLLPRGLEEALRVRDRRLLPRATPLYSEEGAVAGVERSEEHTSELQSLRHLVCRLLLEKKNLRKRGTTSFL